jgi:hypothetical protein
MANVFCDDPTVPGARRWRQSPWRAIGSGITLGLCLLLIAAILAASGRALGVPGALDDPVRAAAVTAGVVLFVVVMGAIARLTFRDMRGQFGASITLTETAIMLRLPRGRSLTHDPPRGEATIPLHEVLCLETRREIYSSQGMASMNRVYRLRRHTGEPIFLFEQRGIGSNVESSSMQSVADELAHRAGVHVRELGTFEGRGGLLGAWMTAPPGWTAAPVSGQRRESLRWRLLFTSAVGLVIGMLWLVRLLIRTT